MNLGANSVLFGGHGMEAAFKYLAMAGYDGIEISAIEGSLGLADIAQFTAPPPPKVSST